MSRLNQRIKALVPNSVRRSLAHALRPLGVPRRLQSILAFEPLPRFADVLERNARHNGMSIELVRAAVSDRAGRAQFFVPGELAGNIYSSSLSREHYERHQHSEAEVLDVEVVAIDVVAE